MKDQDRQTGRTTRLLEEAEAKNAVFVVHCQEMKKYIKYLRPSFPREKIYCVSEYDKLRGLRTEVVIDHTCYEVGGKYLHRLLQMIPHLTA